jgi:hypothetical protein
MDVLPPRAEVAEPVQEMPADLETVEPEPESDFSARPVAEAPAEEVTEPVEAPAEPDEPADKTVEESEEPDESEKPAAAKPATPVAPHQAGVTLAIVATIVIVLGLSAMMVYAYLQSSDLGVL